MCLKKTRHLTFHHNFGKSRPSFKILSVTDSHGNSVWICSKVLHLALTGLLHYLAKFNHRTFSSTIKINLFYLKLNKTWQHSDDKSHKNTAVMIYLIFIQYMKHRIQIMQRCSECGLTTNSAKFMPQTTSLSAEGDSMSSDISHATFHSNW